MDSKARQVSTGQRRMDAPRATPDPSIQKQCGSSQHAAKRVRITDLLAPINAGERLLNDREFPRES